MKKVLMLLFALLVCQTSVSWAQNTDTVKVRAAYGFLSYNAVMKQMPEYAAAQNQITKLQNQYIAETKYNEASFNQMFTDFLAGQKDFPQTILLKRQKELQEALEKGTSFRQQADSLMQRARENIMQPVMNKLNNAIQDVVLERGYNFIVNLDNKNSIFLHPKISEDATGYVLARLAKMP